MVAADDEGEFAVLQMLADAIGQLDRNVLHCVQRVVRNGLRYPDRFVPAETAAGFPQIGKKPERPQHLGAVLTGRIAGSIAIGDTNDDCSMSGQFLEPPYANANL